MTGFWKKLTKSISVTCSYSDPDYFSDSAFSSHPETVRCPYCHHIVTTLIAVEPSPKTHCIALLLLFVCLPCSCLPYCIYSCNNHHHYCPVCGGYIGSHFF